MRRATDFINSKCYMPTPLPRRDRVGALSLLPHSTAAFPEILPGRLPRFGLSRPAQRSLTFRPACSLNRPRRSVSSEAPTATGWNDPSPGGNCTHWKSPPLHGAQYRPHMTLEGSTPNEVYFRRWPAKRLPRLEPRKQWPRRSRCAKPSALVAGQPGDRFSLEVGYHDGHRHLPVVSLRRAA